MMGRLRDGGHTGCCLDASSNSGMRHEMDLTSKFFRGGEFFRLLVLVGNRKCFSRPKKRKISPFSKVHPRQIFGFWRLWAFRFSYFFSSRAVPFRRGREMKTIPHFSPWHGVFGKGRWEVKGVKRPDSGGWWMKELLEMPNRK